MLINYKGRHLYGVEVKLNEWEKNLENYIEQVRTKPFQWGFHDCIVFSNQAMKVQTGKGYLDDYLPDYETALQAKRTYQTIMTNMGVKDMREALDSRLKRFIGLVPPKGSIVARKNKETDGYAIGYNIGIALDHRVRFISREGIVFLRVEVGDTFWAVD